MPVRSHHHGRVTQESVLLDEAQASAVLARSAAVWHEVDLFDNHWDLALEALHGNR